MDGYGIGASEITGVQGRYLFYSSGYILIFANKKLNKYTIVEKIYEKSHRKFELLAISMLSVSIMVTLLDLN